MRYKRQLARTVEEARRIITVSQISFSALSAYSRVDPAKVRVIHNGVSEQFHRETDEAVLQRRAAALLASASASPSG